MQKVGTTALFLPVVSRISARTGLPMSRLLMPMGFCAILGGTVSMVGSSPLILLNLLVPLAVNIAVGVGADPAVFALTVAIATSNSFIIPTHQVKALIMGPGGYGVADFLRASGIMTALFLVVLLVAMNLFYS